MLTMTKAAASPRNLTLLSLGASCLLAVTATAACGPPTDDDNLDPRTPTTDEGGHGTTTGSSGGGSTSEGGAGGAEPDPPPTSDAWIDVDFEHRVDDQPYRVPQIEEDFVGDDGTLFDEDQTVLSWPDDVAHVVADPYESDNRVLRVLLKQGEKVFPKREFSVRFPDTATQAELSYRVMWEEGTTFRGAYKLPRMRGFRPGSDTYFHEDPDPDGPGGEPTWAFSTAIGYYGPQDSYAAQTSIYPYVYWADQPKPDVGKSFPAAATLQPGQWYTLRFVVEMNTPNEAEGGAENGVFEIYVDGELVERLDDLRLRDTDDLGVNVFSFMSWSNSGTQTDQYLYFDDFHMDPIR